MSQLTAGVAPGGRYRSSPTQTILILRCRDFHFAPHSRAFLRTPSTPHGLPAASSPAHLPDLLGNSSRAARGAGTGPVLREIRASSSAIQLQMPLPAPGAAMRSSTAMAAGGAALRAPPQPPAPPRPAARTSRGSQRLVMLLLFFPLSFPVLQMLPRTHR